MLKVDTKDLPEKGTQIRIRLRDNLWLYTQVESVAPTRTFFTMKVLGVKEYEDEVEAPAPLKDPKDTEGPLDELPAAPRGGRSSSPRSTRDPSLPPSPALDVEEFPGAVGPADEGLF